MPRGVNTMPRLSASCVKVYGRITTTLPRIKPNHLTSHIMNITHVTHFSAKVHFPPGICFVWHELLEIDVNLDRLPAEQDSL